MTEQKSHWNGEIYNKISLPQYQINKRFIDAHDFTGNERILDIGCGNGNTTQLLLQKIPHGSMIGVDASSSMIEAAKLKYAMYNVDFRCLDAQALNFENEFDLVTCFFCMQWIPDKVGVFKKIAKALIAGGEFLLIVPTPHPHLPTLRAELMARDKWKKYFVNYQDPLMYINDCDYQKYAAQNFKLINYEAKVTPVNFSTYTEFFSFMHEMTPQLSLFSDGNLKTEFLTELLDAYLKVCPLTAEGQYQLNIHLVQMKACASF